jgi:DNA repair protein RadC
MEQDIKALSTLAKEILLVGKNNLNQLGKLTVKELMRIKGIGEAKAVTIAAARGNWATKTGWKLPPKACYFDKP